MFHIFLFIAFCAATLINVVSWNIGIRVGSGNNYQIPHGYTEHDYSNYRAVGQLGTEVIKNYDRLKETRDKLEQNESSDLVVKILSTVSMIVFTLGAILMRMKVVKDSVEDNERGQ